MGGHCSSGAPWVGPRIGYIQLFETGVYPGSGPPTCLSLMSLDCQNVPSFLIDTYVDEVSQTGYPCFTEFSTCFTEFGTRLTLGPG